MLPNSVARLLLFCKVDEDCLLVYNEKQSIKSKLTVDDIFISLHSIGMLKNS